MRALLSVCAALVLTVLAPQVSAEIRLGDAVQVPTPEGKFTMPTFAPNGSGIAFSRADYGGLYFTDWQGSAATIAEAPLAGWRYSWTGDGRNLAYRVRYGDTDALAGMVANPDGTGQTQVTDWQSDLFPPQCGKDGISFKAGDDILTVDDKGKVKSVKSLSDGRGTVSRVIALSSALFANGLTGVTLTSYAALIPAAVGKGNPKDIFTNQNNELWTVDENGNMKQLIDIAEESGYFSPQTSPTGDAIAAPGLSGKLYVADASGNSYVDLGMGQNPAWSPDGRYLVYEVVSDNGHDITSSNLWIASRDGKWKRQLTTDSGMARYPAWSPDGRMLAYEIDGSIYYAPIKEQ